MCFARSITLVMLILTASLGNSALAQKRSYESRTDRLCGFGEPRTRLEEFDGRLETVLIKGSATIATFNPRVGAVRIDAIELRDAGNSTRASGIAVRLNDATHPKDNRAFIDYDEIDDLVKSIDQIARADDTITKLQHFEARYRTKGDLEIAVFRQTSGGNIAATVSSGACEQVTIPLSLEELNKFRWMIVQAKARLDEIK
jgi:hypothetical protein